MNTGYLSDLYCQQFGEVFTLPSGARLIKRPIEGTKYFDLINPYPYFFAQSAPSDHDFYEDLVLGEFTGDRVEQFKDIVSLTLITHPLDMTHWVGVLDGKEFKDHYIVNLQSELKYSTQCNRNLKKWSKSLNIVELNLWQSDTYCELWAAYQNLMCKHNVEQDYIANYSQEEFLTLLKVPGAFRFESNTYDQMGPKDFLGFGLFYRMGEDIYYHIGASTDEGYKVSQSTAIIDRAIETFRNFGFRYLILGGEHNPTGGLARFKSGFGSFKAKNYIIKKVLNQKVYDKLSKGKKTDFFPAYRG